MKNRLAVGAAIIVLQSLLGCGPRTYPVTFVCDTNGGTTCPPGTECPALPLGTDTCGDLPGLFGHPETPVTVGRPVGCLVGLSYGNPYYGDSQQTCTCGMPLPSDPSPTPRWQCGI